MNAATEYLNAVLKRDDYLGRFSREELLRILPILESAHDEVLGKIAKTAGEWTKAWLAEVASDIDAIYQAAVKKAYGLVEPDLKGLAKDESAWAKAGLESVTGGLSITAPSPALLWATINALPAASGATLGQLFEALGINSREAVIQAIQLGMVEGETVDEMTRRIRGKVLKRASWRKGPDGKKRYVPGTYEGGALEGVSTRQAEMLARTAVMHVANQAREAIYQDNGDIIKGYQRVETLDLRTCLICGADDGHVYAKDEPRPELPAHPDCRGVWVPVLKSWEELGMVGKEFPPGTRASMDGEVAEMETFSDRLAKMSAKQRVEALGPGRAALYERGMPLEDMVKDGKVVPLADLGGKKKGQAA